MENPAEEIKHVIQTLTQGTPEEQHDAIYRYYTPGATFEHPFCRVPSFTNLNVPGVGHFDSRALITAVYRCAIQLQSHLAEQTFNHRFLSPDKILSPRINLEIESCVLDEKTNIIYLRVFQIFSIWCIPFHRAPVRLVSVLHLAPTIPSDAGTPPPPYDAAKEKLHAVQEGAEPSYAAVASGGASAEQAEQHHQEQQEEARRRATRYLIKKQEDLYQVNEFLKFVLLGPGAAMAGLLQLFSTLTCLVGAILLGPFMKAIWPARAGNAKQKQY
ncbi:hypothetical protein N657DRAFT_679138 [Parathielavia appendiculata]|uniref:SigF-like NTF2-like domain-containing protein n=1 Tax=Parathielavia appendiculata TaxID=2587402 RepID=A0AAN6U485_9PEZI|nr:hypothetical protein N657DRAFT_679138 [Parathielavia appendiculata]